MQEKKLPEPLAKCEWVVGCGPDQRCEKCRGLLIQFFVQLILYVTHPDADVQANKAIKRLIEEVRNDERANIAKMNGPANPNQ